ncbi:MAG: hypothetical protein V4695_12215 [Pseudomonadota bacterium]
MAVASELGSLPNLRNFMQRLRFAKPKVQECDNIKILRQYMNIDLARQILEDNRACILPRDANLPPPNCGMLAIVAYTAGHLDRQIAHMEQVSANGINRPEFRQLASTKALIAGTISRIQKTDVSIVRRNVQFTKETIAGYTPGKTIQFDRLTSVTYHPQQVFTGGNVDFVIHTANGVVSIDPLSHFKSTGLQTNGGEAEGMLDIDSRYSVIAINSGKENGNPSIDENCYPTKTIVLQEIDTSQHGAIFEETAHC